jgi:hypothetical protein
MDDKSLARAIAVYSAVNFMGLGETYIRRDKEHVIEVAKYFAQFIEGK